MLHNKFLLLISLNLLTDLLTFQNLAIKAEQIEIRC